MSDPRQTPAVPPQKYRESRTIRLRQGLAIALLVLTVILLLYWWRGRHGASVERAKIPPVGLTIRQTAHGFSLSRSEGGKPVFRIYADQAIQLKQGSQAQLKNVRIDLYDRDGVRADQIYGQEFAYDPSTGIVTAQGLVHIDLGGIPGQQTASAEQEPGEETGHPIHIQTRNMVFNTRTGIGEVREGLDFAYLGAQGNAESAHVTTHPDVLTLQGHVQLHWTRSDGPPVEVSSDSARLDKLAALIELDGNASVTTGPQHLRADRLQFLLRPDYSVRQAIAIGHVTGAQQDANRTLNAQAAQAQAFFVAPAGKRSGAAVHPGQAMQLTSLRLEGGAELRETAPRQHNRLKAGAIALLFDAKGDLQKMEARQDATLSLVTGAAGKALQPPAGSTKLLSLGGSAGSRSISAPGLDFFFDAGQSGKRVRIRQLQSVGRAHIETRDAASSWMTADANLFTLGFDARQHPLRSEASGNVLLKQQPAPVKGHTQPVQVSQSDHLVLEFLPGQNRLKEAVQQGHVQLQQSDRRVRADQLRYDPVAGVALLQSESTSSFTHGQVLGEDATLRFRSPQARLDLRQDRVEGWGGVQVSFLPGAAQSPAPEGPMFHAHLPVDITADRMNVLEKSGRGTFTGHVRLWQGPNLTLANVMNFDRGSGDVLATGSVVSAFVQPPSGKSGAMPDLLSKLPGKAPAPVPSAPRQASPISITADRLTYSDTRHQGTYLGHVVLTSAQARLTAGRLQVDLAPSASKTASAGPAVLQRVTASEDVKITQPGREAKAQTVVYDMAENRITMRGGPPSIYDAEHGYLTGETLTFFPSNDTIRVESEPGKRTFGEYRVKH